VPLKATFGTLTLVPRADDAGASRYRAGRRSIALRTRASAQAVRERRKSEALSRRPSLPTLSPSPLPVGRFALPVGQRQGSGVGSDDQRGPERCQHLLDDRSTGPCSITVFISQAPANADHPLVVNVARSTESRLRLPRAGGSTMASASAVAGSAFGVCSDRECPRLIHSDCARGDVVLPYRKGSVRAKSAGSLVSSGQDE
jgi:hypothetical protein